MFRCLAGNVPFGDRPEFAMVTMRIAQPSPPLSDFAKVDLPEGLEALIMKAIEIQPADRFADAAEMNDALGAIIARQGWTRDALTTLQGMETPERRISELPTLIV